MVPAGKLFSATEAGQAAGTTAAGLLAWTNRDDGGLTFQPTRAKPMITARLAKIGQWLRENF